MGTLDVMVCVGDLVYGTIWGMIDAARENEKDNIKAPRRTLVQLGRAHRELQTLGQIIRDLTRTRDPSEMFVILEKAILNTFHVRSMTFALVNHAENCLDVSIHRGPDADRSLWRFPLDHPDITCEVARTGRPEVIDGWDPRYYEHVMDTEGKVEIRQRDRQWGQGTTAFFVPIFAGDRVIGVAATGALLHYKAIVLSELERMRPFLSQLGATIALVFETNERIREQETLRTQSLVLKHMVEGVSVATEQGIIQYTNPAEDEMFGYLPGELIGQHVTVLNTKPPEENMRMVSEVISQLQHKGFWHGEFENRRKNGLAFVTDARISSFVNQAGEKFWVCVQEDITDRKRIEAALVQAKEEAETANQAKSQFLANLSHEIRTPMNGILGMIDLALDTDLTDEQHEYIRLIRSSALSLLTVMNDLLDFSRLEAGKMVVESTPFDVRESLADMMAGLRVGAERKGLAFSYKVLPEVPEWVVGDPGRIRQVLMNLAGNAIKFTERGSVEVIVSCLDYPSFPEEEKNFRTLRFSVRDTGIGIPQDRQQKIFDAFSQADASTTRRFGGTGLGLTIVSQLVALMGGTVSVESTEGVGSLFCCTVRVGYPARMETSYTALPVASAVLDGLRILVVEDNPTSRYFMLALLKRRGCRVEEAENGEVALAALCASSYDLVFIDVEMPIMDGLETARRIRAQESENAKKTCLIALTAHATTDDRERCLKAGMDGYLSKPLDMEKLLEQIRIFIPEAPSRMLPERPGDMELPEQIAESPELLRPMLSLFLEESPRTLETLHSAIAKGDSEQVRYAAHTLKGMSKHFGAETVAGLADRLERMGKEGDLQEAIFTFRLLSEAMEKLAAWMQDELARLTSG